MTNEEIMREHIYRAQMVEGKEWVYGYFYKIWGKTYILWGMINNYPDMTEVIPETVCEYTGLTDKTEKKIFEGDVVLLYDGRKVPIVFEQGAFQVHNKGGLAPIRYAPLVNCTKIDGEVIGTIFDEVRE